MKLYNNVLIILIVLSTALTSCEAQVKNAKISTAKVYGNCEMCKKTIETAANKKGIVKAEWNVDSKILTMTYDSTRTNADDVLKSVAYAGYDNEKFIAPDEAYNGLDGCCQYDRPGKHEAHEAGQKADSAKMVAETGKQLENPLKEVYDSYFAVKDALANDDATKASKQANTLADAIAKAPMDKMEPAVHTVWMKYQKELSSDAGRIKGTTDLESQRKYFITLSKNMHELIKVSKMDVTVYYDFCPMADDGKGATWLSLQKPISNPYMGKSMPTCGKVQETIAK